MFTKRELELQDQQTLDDYKALVKRTAKQILLKRGIESMCLNHWHQIRTKDNFESDVHAICDQSMTYA